MRCFARCSFSSLYRNSARSRSVKPSIRPETVDVIWLVRFDFEDRASLTSGPIRPDFWLFLEDIEALRWRRAVGESGHGVVVLGDITPETVEESSESIVVLGWCRACRAVYSIALLLELSRYILDIASVSSARRQCAALRLHFSFTSSFRLSHYRLSLLLSRPIVAVPVALARATPRSSLVRVLVYRALPISHTPRFNIHLLSISKSLDVCIPSMRL